MLTVTKQQIMESISHKVAPSFLCLGKEVNEGYSKHLFVEYI